MSARKWTETDENLLREWYRANPGANVGIDSIAQELGRTPAAVFLRASRLGITNRARPASEAAKAAVGAAARARIAEHGHPKGALGMTHSDSAREAMSRQSIATWKRRTQSQVDQITEKRNATLMAKYGCLAPGQRYRNPYSRTKYGRRGDLGERFFRSAWEANYARYLKFLVSKGEIEGWLYECETFWFERIRRGVRSYTPDFKILRKDGSSYFVEVKGWMDAKSATKIKRMRIYHPEIELQVVDGKAYKALASQLSGIIPYWE